MTERTYTKGDLMDALNKMKTPTEDESVLPGPLNETEGIRIAIAGAESLIEAVECGSNPRNAMCSKVGKLSMIMLIERESPKIAEMFKEAFGFADEAEKITTPPEESDS